MCSVQETFQHFIKTAEHTFLLLVYFLPRVLWLDGSFEPIRWSDKLQLQVLSIHREAWGTKGQWICQGLPHWIFGKGSLQDREEQVAWYFKKHNVMVCNLCIPNYHVLKNYPMTCIKMDSKRTSAFMKNAIIELKTH